VAADFEPWPYQPWPVLSREPAGWWEPWPFEAWPEERWPGDWKGD
jgi:hypothetical protein